MDHPFRGLGTALVTPFKKGGGVDEQALRELIRFQIKAKVDFLVPLGTTGEATTLEDAEYFRVVEICLEEAHGKLPLLVGAGSNSTAHSIHLTRELHRMGVQGTLQVVPYYNKPTPEGQYRHFREIAGAAPIPMVVYNIQSRTALNMNTSTLMRLAKTDNIVGVKEASGNLAQMLEVLHQRPNGFTVLSGDDMYTLALIACGGDGVISVLSNIAPADMRKMVQLALSGKIDGARKLQDHYLELIHDLFIETNPIPVKTALAAMGMIEEHFRLPLTGMQSENKAKLVQTLKRVGLK